MGTKTKKNVKTATTATKRVKTGIGGLNTVAFNVSVPRTFLKKIDARAKKANLPRSAYVRTQLQASM